MAAHVVLVTGASGFLGRAIAERLVARNLAVIGLDPAPATNPSVRHIADDLSDAGRLREVLTAGNVTHIIHAGGISGPMLLADQPMDVITINVGGSLNLLRAALETGVKTFIYCSSVSAIGHFYEKEPIGEDYPLWPVSTYGCSKAAMDMVLRGLWRRVALDLCSLRFTGIYGPGRQTDFVIDDIVAAALAGRPVKVEPATDWPFVYVDDAADAAVAACFSDQRKQLVYFVSYPQQVSLDDLAAAAREAAGPVSLEIDPSRPRVARGSLDIAPAVRDFGFAPKVDHREGIRRMAAARRPR